MQYVKPLLLTQLLPYFLNNFNILSVKKFVSDWIFYIFILKGTNSSFKVGFLYWTAY